MSSFIHQSIQPQSLSSLNTITQNDNVDSFGNELKTEFYTREGLWTLVPNSDYVRQPQNLYTQPPNVPNGNVQQMNNNCGNVLLTSNEPVKIITFKYFRFDEVLSPKNLKRYKNLCVKCAQKKSLKAKSVNKSNSFKKPDNSKVYFGNMREYDDDEDIIYDNAHSLSSGEDSDTFAEAAEFRNNFDNFHNRANCETNVQNYCKYCNAKIYKSNDLNSLIANFNASSTFASTPCLDLVIFNYAREIYFHEANDIKAKITNDMKNLVDKKAYRTFISTCFDLNINASMLNTVELQANSTRIDASTSLPLANNHQSAPPHNDNSLGFVNTAGVDLSPSHLSLIIAAGFNRGEIHVFDGFKKEASVFYNNNRLVEKTKVTCIKWLPNSMNLFLVGHSSGCIYLYDATNQAQPTVAPTFTKLYQDESFAIHLNPNTPSNANILADKVGDISKPPLTTSRSLNQSTNHSVSAENRATMLSAQSTPKKLVLSNTNQIPTAIAKNPLLKWSIGAVENSTEGLKTFTSMNNAGVNGVNEFSFSPCGSYLAIVSQDGYLRVFAFAYQNNQELQVQLLCSMKSYFGGLLCCCWSSDGRYIATGGEDDFITIFSFVEMRVACRGRGHNSWINACTFDPWTFLNTENDNKKGRNRCRKSESNRSNRQTNKKGNEQKDGESDSEEYQANQRLKNLNINPDLIKPSAASSPQQSTESSNTRPQPSTTKKHPITKKNRTISTLSDFNYSSLDQNHLNGSVYYRLASCGQDNQIAFWDLTEDVLKEKTTQHQSRSRLTSVNTPLSQKDPPKIVIQPNDMVTSGENGKSSMQTKTSHTSLVSTAKNLFSLKHSDSGKSKTGKGKVDDNEESVTQKGSTSSMTAGFFKKHKRNSSLSQSEYNKNPTKNSQITLNSYTKKAPIPGTAVISSISDNINYNHHLSYNRSYTESGITLNAKGQRQELDTCQLSAMTGKPRTAGLFNICPKLDEVPMIEPLICKRIGKERLTDIKFKEDCFIVSTQDGYVYTWSRPVNPNLKSS